jgi:circadian clock protein KaiC
MAARGERSVAFIFEEAPEMLRYRAEAVGIPIAGLLERGTLQIVPVEPLRYSSDEFARMLRDEVELRQARLVMIDSSAGYQLTVRGGNVAGTLHAACKYLQNMGVTVILCTEVESITGGFRATDIGISYLADNIIFLRYFEARGEIRRAIGVLKKRLSDFEKTLRELTITSEGLVLGRPLTYARGILTGVPDLLPEERTGAEE